MAHRRSFRGRSQSGSQARKKTWSPLMSDTGGVLLPMMGTLSPSSLTVATDFFIFTLRPDVEESTIIRTHLQGTFTPKGLSGSTAAQGFTFAVGMGIVTEEAALGGAVPEAADSIAWDGWFVHEMFSWNVASGFVENRAMVIDSKAMRKLESGNVVIVSLSVAAGSGTVSGDLDYSFGGRQLVLLP